jgi:hypothetical protein
VPGLPDEKIYSKTGKKGLTWNAARWKIQERTFVARSRLSDEEFLKVVNSMIR